MDLGSNPYYAANPKNFISLLELVNSHPFSFHRMLRRKGCAKLLKAHPDFVPPYKNLADWIESVVPGVIRSDEYRLATKVFWILRGMTGFPACPICGKREGYVGKNVRSVFLGYHGYCSGKCMQASKDVREKRKATSLRNNGVEFPAQNPEIIGKTLASKFCKYGNKWGDLEKQAKTNLELYGKEHPYEYGSDEFRQLMVDRYGFENPLKNPDIAEKAKASYWESVFGKYGGWPMQNCEIKRRSMENRAKSYERNGVNFDSKPEIAYYVWLTDNEIRFEYHPKDVLEYKFEGVSRRYFPDFKVFDGDSFMYVEIKGDQFFRSDGTMYCPYRSSKWSDSDYDAVCRAYEAKHQYMLSLGVVIMREKDYMKYLDYVSAKYGPEWLDGFKKR